MPICLCLFFVDFVTRVFAPARARARENIEVSVFAPVLLVAVCALPLMVMKNIYRCCKLHYYTVVIEWQREIAGCIAAFEKGTNTNLCH